MNDANDTCNCGHPANRHAPNGRCIVMEPSHGSHIYVSVTSDVEICEPGDRRWHYRGGMDQCACGWFVGQPKP